MTLIDSMTLIDYLLLGLIVGAVWLLAGFVVVAVLFWGRPVVRVPLPLAFERLAKASKGRWEGVDASEFVHGLREDRGGAEGDAGKDS